MLVLLREGRGDDLEASLSRQLRKDDIYTYGLWKKVRADAARSAARPHTSRQACATCVGCLEPRGMWSRVQRR